MALNTETGVYHAYLPNPQKKYCLDGWEIFAAPANNYCQPLALKKPHTLHTDGSVETSINFGRVCVCVCGGGGGMGA